MTTRLEHLLKLANYSLNETYSADYHSSLEDFENDKIKTINSIKKSASEELIDSIDKISIKALRQNKLIYNQIVEIANKINQ